MKPKIQPRVLKESKLWYVPVSRLVPAQMIQKKTQKLKSRRDVDFFWGGCAMFASISGQNPATFSYGKSPSMQQLFFLVEPLKLKKIVP